MGRVVEAGRAGCWQTVFRMESAVLRALSALASYRLASRNHQTTSIINLVFNSCVKVAVV